MDDTWRKERIARNETCFRDINERLEEGLRHVQHATELQDFVCECGDRECEQLVSLTFDEYERIRRDSRHFAVVPGHVYPEAERVVEEHERFQVVEKTGVSVLHADARDQRARGDDGGLREG